MSYRAKLIAIALATGLLAACWGDDGDEGEQPATVEECRSTTTLTNRMLHKSQRLESGPGVCYMVPEQITVGTDVRLEIEPGVKVVFADDAGLTVHEGRLIARGTKDQPIIFTANRKEPGAWSGIRFMNSPHAENVVEHAVIEYGGATPGFKGVKPANLMLDDYYGKVNVVLRDVTMRHSGGYGLYAEEEIHSKFANNTLTKNKKGAAHLHPVFVDQIDTGSDFTGNGRDVVELAGATFDQQTLRWPGLKVPYEVTGSISLTGNSFVDIGPGAVFKFHENTGVSVFRSRFSARGKKDAPVVFTGIKEVPGYWRGIRYIDSNSVDNVLEHVAVRYGGASPTYKGVEPANLMLDDYYGKVRLKMNNVELSRSGAYGFYAEEKMDVDFGNNKLVDNERAAALLHPVVVGYLDDQTTYGITSGEQAGPGRVEILGAKLDGVESTWPAIDARYVVRGDVVLRDDSHVTISPGATVAFAEGAGLSVYRSRLTARGTEEAPITFTGASKKPGFWKGIHLVDTSSVENVFEHVVIEYGGSPRTFKGAEPANLMFDDYFGLVSATMNDVTSRHSGAAGLHIEWGAKIRSNSCGSIKVEDETPVTKAGKSLGRACRG
ncbi:hypothetical protein FIV42_06215 [Persicimonas caeni]|uniref:Right-handed parallel beta-helix repeat-containing protein n=1 Tax=Persicimonas caeni TaxID=2292766 RepID=A0A4Y6PPY4_PERCE|nr:hypothetical protein [Persicimonas caeni]QDG50340.1 hypothetical protein FIV42_06215 [Persicimonas caeni]QED31561.1 hypothetical protein FRD00_06210 [Persicimonas caeni]